MLPPAEIASETAGTRTIFFVILGTGVVAGFLYIAWGMITGPKIYPPRRGGPRN